MRWTIPYDHEKRVVIRFPILPRLVDREVRWLEIVYIKQLYSKLRTGWVDMSYVTKEDYINYKGEKKLNE